MRRDARLLQSPRSGTVAGGHALVLLTGSTLGVAAAMATKGKRAMRLRRRIRGPCWGDDGMRARQEADHSAPAFDGLGVSGCRVTFAPQTES